MKTTRKNDAARPLFGKGYAVKMMSAAGWLSLALSVLLFACGLFVHVQAASAPQVMTYRDDAVIVTATFGAEAQIPKEAVLRAVAVTPESDPESYSSRMAAAMSAAGQEGEAAPKNALYDLGFYVGEQPVEPAAPVDVTVQLLRDGFAVGEPIRVVHFGEENAEVIADTAVDEDGCVSFTTDGFSDFAFILGTNGPEDNKGNMKDLLGDVTITDRDGNSFTGGQLHVGEKYTITLTFSEGGVQQSSKQFTWGEDGTMTYQLPKYFKVEAKSDISLTIKVNGKDVTIGTYSVTEDGKIVVKLTKDGQKTLDETYNASLNFEMDTTVQSVEGSDSGKVDFGGTGEDFDFEVVDQASVEVDKQGKYVENDDKTGGELKYTVTTTVKRGSVHDLSILDEFTPPNTSALNIEDVNSNDIKVTLKQRGVDDTVTAIELKYGEDYELVEVPDAEHPGKKTFQVKLKEGGRYSTLNEGDVLEVTYPYKVEYVKGATDVFWGNVANDVHVTGKGKVPAPADAPEKETPEINIDEHRGSNVEIQVTPPGDGIIFKTQEFSEKDHKLHYTLYTTVPAGDWTPFYIQDDMVVEFGGQRYNLTEFKEGGRVSNLKVSAVDVETGKFGNWSDSTDEQRQQSLEELKKQAQRLIGYDIYGYAELGNELPGDYDSSTFDNYISLWHNNNLDILFGEVTKDNNGAIWGHWNYKKDRLIITEYDLDMSDAQGPLSLVDTSDYQTTIEKEASEVLLAGIRNTVHMRFDGYNPGYSVFFNNAERMNKTGVPDKSDNSITWTVTMNTTDTTVNQYFQDVTADWMTYAADKYNWANNEAAYSDSMQAVFYDVLPDGWEYVEGSLTATACDEWGNEASYPYNGAHFYDFHDLVTQDGNKQVIRAPLMFFNDVANTGRPNLFNWIGTNLTSLTFTYKLKATDEWIRDHATDTKSIPVNNHAEIRDKLSLQPHWEADANVPYLPQHLSKTAQQVGDGSNLLRFTLSVNPGSLQLDSEQGYLVVTDKSDNLAIQKGTIKVTEADGTELEQVDYTEGMTLQDHEWAIMPETEGGQFKIMVPDGKALLVVYDALIQELGTGIPVSNIAGIEGVGNSTSGFDRFLNVTHIVAGGDGSTYTMNFKKVSTIDEQKMLPGAKFKFYIVRSEESTLDETKKIPVGGIEYSCYSEDDWKITTEAEKLCEIPSKWKLSPGNYYILEEITPPDGYETLKEPVLFYYGAENPDDLDGHPHAQAVGVGGILTVADPPVPYELPETGGPGLSLYLAAALLLILGGGVALARRRRAR